MRFLELLNSTWNIMSGMVWTGGSHYYCQYTTSDAVGNWAGVMVEHPPRMSITEGREKQPVRGHTDLAGV